MSADKAGCVKLAPGLYADPTTNTMHLDLAELLEANGYPVTPDTCAAMERAVDDLFGEQLGMTVKHEGAPW